MEHLRLSDGEWKLMKALWSRQPQTLAELVAALDAETGWSRATIFMMLKRLIAKGAVTMDDSGKFQEYSTARGNGILFIQGLRRQRGDDGIEPGRPRRAV